MISPSQRLLPDNTQHSQQTNIHAPGGIRTHNISRRAAADLRLRLRGHWDRLQPHVLGLLNNPCPRIEALDVATKPANTHKFIRLSYITNIIFVLHVSAFLVAIFREVHYKGYIYMCVHETGLVIDRFAL